MSSPPTVWYEAPAARWLAALPVGNGRLGASVFGRVYKETVIVNEESVWTRWPDDRNNPGALNALPEVRRLLMEGRVEQAHTLAELTMFGMPHRQASYQVLGDMTLLVGGHHEELVSDYRRSLDLDDGILAVEYELDGTRFRREAFASAPDDVLVLRFEASDAGAVELGSHYYRRYDAFERIDGTDHVIGGVVGARGTAFSSRARVVAEGGTVERLGDHLSVRGADAITILVAAATDFRHDEHEQACLDALAAAAARPFAELRARHIESHRPPMERVRLRLGDERDEDLEALPTDVRLERVKAGSLDPGLVELHFQFGRYLLLGSSRPGRAAGEPAGDLERQLPARVGQQVHDQHQPADELLARRGREPRGVPRAALRPDRQTARQRGGDGATALRLPWLRRPPQHRPLGRHGAPRQRLLRALARGRGLARAPPLGAATRTAWTTTFLRERAYPGMKEAARFVLDFLVEDPESGELLFGPSLSPENQYLDANGVRSGLCMSPAGDTQIIAGLFDRCLRAARASRRRRRVPRRARGGARAPSRYARRRRGQLQEWREDYVEYEEGHRHVSHLFAVYPDAQITRDPHAGARAGCSTVARAAYRRGLRPVDRRLERRVALASLGALSARARRRTSS